MGNRSSDINLTIDEINYAIGDGEWLTINNYCIKYGKSIANVLNWISRGKVYKSEVVVVTELNNMKLIRDQDYSYRLNLGRKS